MTTYPHDIDLGQKPDAKEQHRLLANGRHDPMLLAILHYLRDEAAECLKKASDALRNEQPIIAHAEFGGHELLLEAFTKIDQLRKKPLEVEEG